MSTLGLIVFGIMAFMMLGFFFADGLPKSIRAGIVLRFGAFGGLLAALFAMVAQLIKATFSMRE
jgi:hypothetical protein